MNISKGDLVIIPGSQHIQGIVAKVQFEQRQRIQFKKDGPIVEIGKDLHLVKLRGFGKRIVFRAKNAVVIRRYRNRR